VRAVGADLEEATWDAAAYTLAVSDTAFKGRIALVTGGSGGIGAALGARLAEDGAAVAVHYATHRGNAERVVAGIVERGGSAIALGADLRDAAAPEQLVEEVEAVLGPIDVLAANAGMATIRSVEELDAMRFDESIAINLRAPYLLARRVLPGMLARGYGRILFTSSVAGFTGGVISADYASAKAGLHGLTHYLAARVAAQGITVNALAPALIEDTAMLPGDPAELVARIPAGRLGRPEEVADIAVSILRNGYLTSQVVSIDGGIYPR
jgi:3-oxoacyl-[acyl-carrier protein] reductase